MKKKLFIVFTLLSLCLSAQAARFDISAKIGQIRYHEVNGDLSHPWRGLVWVGLVNPNQSPNCVKYKNEYQIGIPSGNEMAISMILAAKMAEKEVLITIDDDVPFLNSCKLQYVTIP